MTTHHPRYRHTPFGRHYATCSCGWVSDAHFEHDYEAIDAYIAHHAQAVTDADLARERAALLAAVEHAAHNAPRRLPAALDAASQAGIPTDELARAADRTPAQVERTLAARRRAERARIRLGIGPGEDIRT